MQGFCMNLSAQQSYTGTSLEPVAQAHIFAMLLSETKACSLFEYIVRDRVSVTQSLCQTYPT